MTKSEMADEQLQMRRDLAQMLLDSQWDPGEWEQLFNHGSISLDPELQAEFKHGETRLLVGWSVERNEISLRIQDNGKPPLLFRVPSTDAELLLVRTLTALQAEITATSFGGVVRAFSEIAGTVYWETSAGTVALKKAE